MRAINPVLSALLGGLLLGGCAGFGSGPATVAGYRVIPVQRMSGMDDPEAWYQRGRYFLGQGRLAQAEQSLRKAVTLNPEHAEAHNALGVVLARGNAPDEAEREFRRALQYAPEEAHIRANLGRLLAMQARDAEALVALEDAARIDPDNPAVRASLDAVRHTLGRPKVVARPEPVPAAAPSVLARVPADPRPQVSVVLPQVQPALGEGRGLPLPVVRAAREPVRVQVLPPVPASDPRAPVQLLTAQPGAAPTVAVAAPLAVLSYAAPAAPRAVQAGPRQEDAVRRTEVPAPATAEQAVVSTPRPEPEAVTSGRAPRLEVANGNGVEGMARRVRAALQSEGFARVRVTNQQPYVQRATVLEYRAGFAAEAQSLGARLCPQAPLALVEARLDPRADLRLVLGRDLSRQYAVDGNLAMTTPETAVRLAGAQ